MVQAPLSSFPCLILHSSNEALGIHCLPGGLLQQNAEKKEACDRDGSQGSRILQLEEAGLKTYEQQEEWELPCFPHVGTKIFLGFPQLEERGVMRREQKVGDTSRSVARGAWSDHESGVTSRSPGCLASSSWTHPASPLGIAGRLLTGAPGSLSASAGCVVPTLSNTPPCSKELSQVSFPLSWQRSWQDGRQHILGDPLEEPGPQIFQSQ